MPVLGAFFRRALRSRQAQQPINLLDVPTDSHSRLDPIGLDLSQHQLPWSLARFHSIIRALSYNSSEQAVVLARHARHRLSSFWLSAPADALQGLYEGPIGHHQRILLQSNLSDYPLADDEKAWKTQLIQNLNATHERPQVLNTLLALMSYGPFKQSEVDLEDLVIPDWLLSDLIQVCPFVAARQRQRPIAQLSSGQAEVQLKPDQLPVLATLREHDALTWLKTPEVFQRLTALLNLYVIDPGDPVTLNELAEARRILCQLFLDVDPSDLFTLYQGEAGHLLKAMASSGFSTVVVGDLDREAKAVISTLVEDLSVPLAMNGLVSALLYFPANKIELEGGDRLIPEWLCHEMAELAKGKPHG